MIVFLTFLLKLQQTCHSVHIHLYLSIEDDLKIACLALEICIWLLLYILNFCLCKWFFIWYSRHLCLFTQVCYVSGNRFSENQVFN